MRALPGRATPVAKSISANARENEYSAGDKNSRSGKTTFLGKNGLNGTDRIILSHFARFDLLTIAGNNLTTNKSQHIAIR